MSAQIQAFGNDTIAQFHKSEIPSQMVPSSWGSFEEMVQMILAEMHHASF
jgi:hypothetical protein